MAITPQKSRATRSPNQPLEQIRQIVQWFEAAIPEPTGQNVHTQIGVHFEEVSEMAQVLRDAGNSYRTREQLTFLADVLDYFQKQLKTGLEIDLEKLDRITLLDALCDQIVTAVGVAHMLGMDIEGALRAVAVSNDSKFDGSGRPIFNDQRKIVRGPHYQSPDLTAYVTKRGKG